MHNLKYQRGLGAPGWILVLALIGFFALVALKTVPVYIDSMTISSILSDMEQEPDLGSNSPSEIITTFFRRMKINNIRYIDRDSIYLETDKDTIVMEVEYEVRQKFVGNMDLVMSFNKRANIPKP